MATRQERCNLCGIQVWVPLQAQTFVCPQCRSLTRRIVQPITRRIVQPMPQNYGYGNTNTNTNVYTMSFPMHNYNPNPGMPGNGYYPRPSSMSPLVVPGRKRAVLCGVSYYGHPKSLKGSINDVRKMHDFLINTLGFPSSSVLLLTEEERDSTRIPTRYNMTMALHWLVGGCQSGDSMVFHYSGHGSQVPDTNGDEIDGYDEALCPVDYQTAGKILDDEINAIIVRPLPPGARLHAIIDTCNSGTILDLAYICSISPEGLYKWKDQWIPHGGYKGTSGGIAISLSACDDHQKSGDTTAFNGNASGALTYIFINVLQNEPRLTYERLLSSMRHEVWEAQNRAPSSSPHSPQVPQLSSSQEFNIHKTPFTL